MLYRRTAELATDFAEEGLAVVALDAVQLDLDEFVGGEAAVDFLEHGLGETLLGDADDGAEMMGGGAQGAALGGS